MDLHNCYYIYSCFCLTMWFYTVSEKAFARIRKDIALWFIHIYIHIYIYIHRYIYM